MGEEEKAFLMAMKAVLHVVDKPELFDDVKNIERTPKDSELLAFVIQHRANPIAPAEPCRVSVALWQAEIGKRG